MLKPYYLEFNIKDDEDFTYTTRFKQTSEGTYIVQEGTIEFNDCFIPDNKLAPEEIINLKQLNLRLNHFIADSIGDKRCSVAYRMGKDNPVEIWNGVGADIF